MIRFKKSMEQSTHFILEGQLNLEKPGVKKPGIKSMKGVSNGWKIS